MSKNIITLGKEGVITDTAKKIDWLMCCFFFSKYSQSTLMTGRVANLSSVIQSTTDDPINLRSKMKDTLTELLTPFFTRCEVDVVVNTEGSEMEVVIDVNISDDNTGAPVSAGYALTYESTVLRSILEKYSNRNLMQPSGF